MNKTTKRKANEENKSGLSNTLGRLPRVKNMIS